MQASALSQHVRDTAVKHLQEQGKAITPEAIEAQGRWLLALWHARNMMDGITLKDLASHFLDGVEAITSIDDECKDITEDEEDGFGPDVIDFINHI